MCTVQGEVEVVMYNSSNRSKVKGLNEHDVLCKNHYLWPNDLLSSTPPVLSRNSYTILSKAGIKVCASQKLNTNLGPVMSSFGVKPLKKLEKPSFLAMLDRILNPLSGLSKFRFCIRVLMTSSGADTSKDADAPAMDAIKFWNQVAEL